MVYEPIIASVRHTWTIIVIMLATLKSNAWNSASTMLNG